MRTLLSGALLIASLCPLSALAQLNNGGINAYFGIDADTRANYVKYGPMTGLIASDDWFASPGIGNNVIDTSNAAYYLSQLQTGGNFYFSQRMSALLYAKVNGKLWLDAAYARDYVAASSLKDTTVFTISSKNGDDPSIWQGGVANCPTKNDLVDVYAHMRRDGLTVHDSLWFYTGVSTFGTTGSSYFDVELYKKNFSYNPSTGIFTTAGTSGGHTEWLFDAAGNITQTGDLILAVSFSPGSVPVIDLRIWVSQTTLGTITPARFNFTGVFNGASASPTYGYATVVSKTGSTAWGSGISNYSSTTAQDTTYSTPWGTANSSGVANWAVQYQAQQFIEIGLNLSRIGVDPALYGALDPCQSLFSNIFFKSRSSTSFASQLKDFVIPLTFLRPPVMDYSVKGDTLRCNRNVATIQITNNTTQGYYTWQTANGTISSSNSDSSQLGITKAGTYIVSASPAPGCVTMRKDTIVIPIDTFPPEASIAVSLVGGLTSTGYLQLHGGDATASNYSTPFGSSQGLLWNWSGPHSFTSAIQNPRTADTAWGTYQLIVTEKRNGCTDTAQLKIMPIDFAVLQSENIQVNGVYAAQAITLTWEDLNQTNMASYEVLKYDGTHGFGMIGTIMVPEGSISQSFSYTDRQVMEGRNMYRIRAVLKNGEVYYSGIVVVNADPSNQFSLAGNNFGPVLTLIANMKRSTNSTLVIYSNTGQLLLKKEVQLQEGLNSVELPSLSHQKDLRLIALYITGQMVYSQKAIF